MVQVREMTPAMRAFAKTLLMLVALALVAAARVSAQTVIVVRHAEKVDASADPVLSEAGQARARALVTALRDAGVTAIVTTQYQRTKLTAAPLAAQLGVTSVVIDASVSPAELAQRIRREHANGTVLVVGHSNTVPAIVKALSGTDVGTIADDRYDDIFVVRVREAGGSVLRLEYGTSGTL